MRPQAKGIPLSMHLVYNRRPPMKLSLRQRLLAVALLGVFSCAVSLFALGRILSLNTSLRLERSREAATTELRVLRHDASAANPGRTSYLGMRGGHVPSATALDVLPADLDAPARALVIEALHAAAGGRDAVLRHDTSSEAVLVAGAVPTDAGALAWVAYSVRPSPFITQWRFIVASLTLATLLLVATAVTTVVSVRRSAATLNASLAALATDLRAPVCRPPVRELADLADHIAGLAEALARAQDDRERLGAELAQRDRLAALGRVAAGIAHEVRNPLASIKLRVDLGRQHAATPPKLAEDLGFVSAEITRLDRLVDNLLVVAGRRRGPRQATALGALVDRRVQLLLPWAGEHGVRVDVSGEATSELDADAVARAVDNLVRNAVEASPASASVEVAVLEGDGAARVQVMDHGAGVDEARLAELFEPFFTTKPEGTGLGLALSRAVAAAHGGTLTYARRDGVTCFELTFPRPSRGAGQRVAA
jgi:signal transduction histidine kinase